jgi:hypothetical protein
MHVSPGYETFSGEADSDDEEGYGIAQPSSEATDDSSEDEEEAPQGVALPASANGPAQRKVGTDRLYSCLN